MEVYFSTVHIVEIWKPGAKAYQWIILSQNSHLQLMRSKTVIVVAMVTLKIRLSRLSLVSGGCEWAYIRLRGLD